MFDDTREDGVRTDLRPAIADPITSASLKTTQVGRRLVESIGLLDSTEIDIAGVRDTLQEWSEHNLNDWLAEHWNLWRLRSELRGQLFTKLYLLRNTMLGIKATSQRRIIRGSYGANIAAFDAILESARKSGIDVLVYIVPLRQDVSPPYDPAEYASFKEQIEKIVRKYEMRFVNLEQLVPAEFWGQKEATGLSGEAEIDFMHFQASGHRLLAKEHLSALLPML